MTMIVKTIHLIMFEFHFEDNVVTMTQRVNNGPHIAPFSWLLVLCLFSLFNTTFLGGALDIKVCHYIILM